MRGAPIPMPVQATAALVTAPILFFDGECGFCDRAIRFAMSRDTHGRLYAATLSGETARVSLPPFSSVLKDVDSTVLYMPANATRDASVLASVIWVSVRCSAPIKIGRAHV